MDRASYVAAGSPRFRDAWAAVEEAVAAVFPDADEAWEYDMPSWTVPLPVHLVGEPQGTMPHDRLTVLVADRKAGPTVHIWNPISYTFLDAHAGSLREAGLKPMRGCLQYTRKRPFPGDAMRRLLEHVHASWK